MLIQILNLTSLGPLLPKPEPVPGWKPTLGKGGMAESWFATLSFLCFPQLLAGCCFELQDGEGTGKGQDSYLLTTGTTAVSQLRTVHLADTET